MSNPDAAKKKIVKALLANQGLRKRGRPRKGKMQDVDFYRAAMVVYVLFEFPGQFRTRREVIGYLKSIARLGAVSVATFRKEGGSSERLDQLEDFARKFPFRDLEQSVSRGMNKNGVLRALEKLAKNSK